MHWLSRVRQCNSQNGQYGLWPGKARSPSVENIHGIWQNTITQRKAYPRTVVAKRGTRLPTDWDRFLEKTIPEIGGDPWKGDLNLGWMDWPGFLFVQMSETLFFTAGRGSLQNLTEEYVRLLCVSVLFLILARPGARTWFRNQMVGFGEMFWWNHNREGTAKHRGPHQAQGFRRRHAQIQDGKPTNPWPPCSHQLFVWAWEAENPRGAGQKVLGAQLGAWRGMG